jgi:hypothetical protein
MQIIRYTSSKDGAAVGLFHNSQVIGHFAPSSNPVERAESGLHGGELCNLLRLSTSELRAQCF